MPTKPRIQDVLETIRHAIVGILNSAVSSGQIASTPAQVVVGWPASTEWVNIANQSQYMVSVYPLPGGKNITYATPETFALPSTQAVPLVATITGGNTITFSGSVVAGLNVYAFVGGNLADAYYKTLSSDNLTTIAMAVKNAINALSLTGISANASGAAVAVTGSPYLSCNIGFSVASFARESIFLTKSIQVSVWAADPMMRYSIMDPIIESLGTTDNSFLLLSDGMAMRIQNSGRGNWDNDKMQSAYSTYADHMIFDVEYYVTSPLTAAQVEALEQDVSLNGNTATVQIGDGIVTF